MRVVFDTNIFVSAFLFPGRQADKALVRVTEGHDKLLISKSIIDEVLDVLTRKFEWRSEAVERVALLLKSISETLATRQRLHLLRDEPDNRILECAIAGNADLIVTGDRELLQLREFERVRVVSLKSYLEMK